VTEVGTIDRDKQIQLADWLRDNQVDTILGPLSWDEQGRPEGAHMIQQYVDGKIRIVLPEDQAEADFIPNKPAW
jgi:branched-chain amino acid transport system substrate-binding protein